MDDVDLAQRNMEFLNSIRRRPETGEAVKATGYCLYCGEPLPRGKRWCDEECRTDWEKEQAARRRNGEK